MSKGTKWAGLALLAATIGWNGAWAYDQYSANRDDTNCRKCHGDFRSTGYVSKVDGQTWANSLHNAHRTTMLSSDCEVCHFTARFPVYLGKATGGTGAYQGEKFSCSGCHGRAADGSGSPTIPSEGFGAGLRQRHFRGGVTECVNCHFDSDPATTTVARENVLPPYYDNRDASHSAQPNDPCNPSPAFVENVEGSTLGLDNDGNGAFDMNDSACNPVLSTPGEAGATAPMLVTGYDKVSGQVTVSYAPGCGASNTNVEYGPISALPTYGYSGQVCSIGNSGTATFAVPGGSFFLVVSHDGTKEGSYGTRSQGGTSTERPEDAASTACPVPQDLAGRCD